MKFDSLSRGFALDFLMVVLACLACLRGSLPLLEPEETRYAELSRQMLETGSWIVPTLDGQPYLDKPPLLYWLVASSYRLLGVSVIVSRLAAMLAAGLTIGIVFRWCRSVAGIEAGIMAAVMLAAMPDFFYRAPMLTMNGLLALATTASMAAGYRALSRERFHSGWWIASAVACGMGFMTKGPIALALVVGPLFVGPWFVRPWVDSRLKKPRFLQWVVFGAVVAAVSATWFLLVESRQPGFVHYFFWKHNVERVVDPFDHAKPWWYYLPQILLGTLPWTVLLFAAGWKWLRRKPVSPLVTFGLTAGLIGLALFSLSGSKRPVYLVPIYPPLAVAAAAFLCGELSASGRFFGMRRNTWRGLIAVISLAIIGVGFAFFPQYHRHFSCSPVLDTLDKTLSESADVYAVPYSSPAVSFAFQKVIPWRPLERLDEIAHPAPNQKRTIIVPVRYAGAVREKLAGAGWREQGNAEIVAFIHSVDH